MYISLSSVQVYGDGDSLKLQRLSRLAEGSADIKGFEICEM